MVLKYVSCRTIKSKLISRQARQLCKILPGQDKCLHLRNDLPLVDQVEDGSIVIVRLMT